MRNWLRALTEDFELLAFITFEPGSKITKPSHIATR